MSRLLKVILVLLPIFCISILWLWWNQTERVDMAGSVPADTLIYLEANSLPEIARSIVSTKTWMDIAPAAGLDSDVWHPGWLTRLAEWTGVGPAESVIFSRAQVAVCVLGFGAAEAPETTLKITPRGAIVIETHTSNGRVRAVAEKAVGDYARRSIGSGEARREEKGETLFLTWVARDDTSKQIVAAVTGSLLVVGNDASAVEACLAVRRGERPSLARDPQLDGIRARLRSGGALAFGYAPAGSAAKIAEALSPLLSQQASGNPSVRGMVAGLLPKLAHRAFGSAAWSTRLEDGRFVDDYFLTLPEGIGTRLALAAGSPDASSTHAAASLLPSDAYQITVYNYGDPEAAWLSLNAGLSTRVDAIHAPLVTLALEALLKPYGVESPREFLHAAKNPVVTARLKEDSDGKVLIVNVGNRERLNGLVAASLGRGAVVSTEGDVQLSVSSEGEERRAACFVSGHLILGREEDVRACLSARSKNLTLQEEERLRASLYEETDFRPHVRTVTSDAEASMSLVSVFARARGANGKDAQALQKTPARVPYSVSETRISGAGLEKRTRSSFGLIGTIITRLSAVDEKRAASGRSVSN